MSKGGGAMPDIDLPPLIDHFEGLDIRMEGLESVKSILDTSNVGVFIIHYPYEERYRYKDDGKLAWVWNHHLKKKLFAEKELKPFVINNTGTDWDLEFFKEYCNADFIDSEMEYDKRASIFVDTLKQILETKDILVLIPRAGDIVRKKSFKNFIDKFLTPISQKNTKGQFLFLLIQNSYNDDCYIEQGDSTLSVQEAQNNLKPFLIEYHGFWGKKEEYHKRDCEAFECWVTDYTLNYESSSDKEYTTKKKEFVATFIQRSPLKIKSDEIEKLLRNSCSCGTIEKLFEKICNEFGYELCYDSDAYRWGIAKINYPETFENEV